MIAKFSLRNVNRVAAEPRLQHWQRCLSPTKSMVVNMRPKRLQLYSHDSPVVGWLKGQGEIEISEFGWTTYSPPSLRHPESGFVVHKGFFSYTLSC